MMFESSFVRSVLHLSLAVRALPFIAVMGFVLSFCPQSAVGQAKVVEGGTPPAHSPKDASPVESRSQDVALTEFKSDMGGLKKWILSEQAKAQSSGNPASGLKMIFEMNARLGKVRTEGLPEDLAASYKAMAAVVEKMAALFNGLPEKEDAIKTWLQAKGKDAAFREQGDALRKSAEETGRTLVETGRKYGIQKELDFNNKEDLGGKPPDVKPIEPEPKK